MVIFAINVAAQPALDVLCVPAGGSAAEATSSLLLAVCLMLAGESAVVWIRLQTGPW